MLLLTLLKVLVAVNIALPHRAYAVPFETEERSTMVYDFNKLTPSNEIKWAPCYDNFTCTRLQVPLDYDDLSVGNISIAFIKMEAAQQPAENLLVNPGGPGESGVQLLLNNPDALRLWYGVRRPLS